MNEYIDDRDIRIFRHRQEHCRAFEAVLNVPGRAANMVIGTPSGCSD